MLRETRLLITIGLFALIGLSSLWSPPQANAQIDIPGCNGTSEQCANEWLSRTAEGIDCAASYGIPPCLDAYKASGWAKTNALNLFGDGPDGTMGNAFQHCAWIGVIATWNNRSVAIGIGENHEQHVPTDGLQREMDLKNNDIGATIGVDAKFDKLDDMWGYVMHTCEDMARNGELYGPCGLGMYTPDDATRPLTIDECPNSDDNIA
jgi:hypothetical protein